METISIYSCDFKGNFLKGYCVYYFTGNVIGL